MDRSIRCWKRLDDAMSIRLLFNRRIPAARIAAAIGFMLSGVAFASWVVRIPDFQSRLALSEGSLGLVLLGVAMGGLVAMPLSGALIARFGSRPVARGASLSLAAALIVPAVAPSALVLALGLFVLGASSSLMSVALNTQAASLERRMRRPIMAGLHALYSLGGLLGATVGGLVAGAGVGAGPHLFVASLVIASVAIAITPSLLKPGMDGAGSGGRAFVRPSRSLLLMGLVAFCVLFGEGAIADWSAVFLRDIGGAGPALAAAGYAAYSLMMATGRFVGDRLTMRLGPSRLVRLGGATATVGMILAVGQTSSWLTVIGFGAVGAGLATIYPTVLAAAGRLPGGAPAGAIATVSSMGYLGLLAGPPLIGFVAEATSLPIGFGLVGLGTLLIVLMAGIVPAIPRFGNRRASGTMPAVAVRTGLADAA